MPPSALQAAVFCDAYPLRCGLYGFRPRSPLPRLVSVGSTIGEFKCKTILSSYPRSGIASNFASAACRPAASSLTSLERTTSECSGTIFPPQPRTAGELCRSTRRQTRHEPASHGNRIGQPRRGPSRPVIGNPTTTSTIRVGRGRVLCRQGFSSGI